MRKIAILLIGLVLSSCGILGDGLYLKVSNQLDFAREGEVVEVEWNRIGRALISPEKVIVLSTDGQQIPSQVLFDEDGNPTKLLFTADVEAGSSAIYNIRRGEREPYPTQAFGRYVPERLDDYAWENNLTAYRIYGPRLESPQTQGVDVWVKSTSKMIIDEWFARNDYHHNYGEGMDCYKVGNTLGGGALAIIDGGKLALAGNYTKQQCTANGPIRTSAEFEYAPVNIGDRMVTMRRKISLDANSRFTYQEYTFEGFEGKLEVAAGIILHDVKDRSFGSEYVAITEPASDSKDPDTDGDISLAVILQGAVSTTEIDGHIAATRHIQAGETIRMWNGSAWSNADMQCHDAWLREVEQMKQCIESPLHSRFIKRREAINK
ncbi:MAG: DUF4861 family protein [Alistipes sp.]|nr:DUF4861 family protein [Alistipes sp.]